MGIRAALRRIAPPRSPQAAQFLDRYEVASRPFIIAAALLPLFVSPSEDRRWGVLIGVLCWLVFVVDFAVQSRMRVKYLGSRLGILDLAIVAITSPWYLIPGAESGAFVALVRIARLARVVVVARGARRLLDRVGRAALVAVIAVGVCSLAAWRAENGVNPEFASYGDAVWWGVVTLTTVGYGDIVPITVSGRVAGVILMTLGIGLLGVLAGSLASFFRLSPQEEAHEEARSAAERRQLQVPSGTDAPGAQLAAQPHTGTAPAAASEVAALRQELHDLRTELGRLNDQLAHLDAREAPRTGPGPD